MKKEVLYLTSDDITNDVVIIKINKSYHPGLTALELYDVTRGCWKRKIESVKSAKYALATFKGQVVEVYDIDHWCPACELNRKTIPFDAEVEKNRIGFFGVVANEKLREKYIGKSVKNFFKKGEVDPVKLIKAKEVSAVG